jgi:hypothetical protein
MDMRAIDPAVIEEHRRAGGRLSGDMAGLPVLLLTTIGRAQRQTAHDAAGVPRRWRPLGRCRVRGRIAGPPGLVREPAGVAGRHGRGWVRALRGPGHDRDESGA